MSELGDLFAALVARYDDRKQAIEEMYQQLENTGLIKHVVVHRYLCERRGCVLAIVVRIDDVLIARTRDYKQAPATNLARSVESARMKNTLDGDRHWPGHTFDVLDLASWGDAAGMDMNCRCRLRTIMAQDIVETVGDTRPGHPGAPSRI